MGKYKLNRSGFTLIELLAVIVILAILMLLATPAVLNIMNNARVNSFATEAQEFINAAKTKYATDSINNAEAQSNGDTYFIGKSVNSSNEDKDLGKYVDKDLSSYSGKVTIAITDDKTTYSITVSNGTYCISEELKNINGENVKTKGIKADLNGCN